MIVTPKTTPDQEKSKLGKPNSSQVTIGKAIEGAKIIYFDWGINKLGLPNIQIPVASL